MPSFQHHFSSSTHDPTHSAIQLAAAGDGESVMRFFESQGLTPTDIQRMMGGSEADTAEVLGEAATKNASDVSRCLLLLLSFVSRMI